MIYLVLLITSLILSVVHPKVFDSPYGDKEKETSFWIENGKNQIKASVSMPVRNHAAKNVILFIGDGMGVTVNSAGRIYSGQIKDQSGEENSLVWENFPHSAMIKTYNVDEQVSDSAGAASAFLTGVKANSATLSVNGKVELNDCQASLDEDKRTISYLEHAQKAGKDTGVVATDHITGATPAAAYAHSANRDWECDSVLKSDKFNTTGCKDIARQLIEDGPGKNIDVILSGGRFVMGAELPGDEVMNELNDFTICNRSDGRNLVEEWKRNKEKSGKSFKYVTTGSELREIDVKNTDAIMGLFSGRSLPYEYYRRTGSFNIPSLKEMTEAAIKRLSRNTEGYFLLVEGSHIDNALHDARIRLALEDVVAMNDAVETALNMIDLDETLLIVTADHSHTLTFSGYPERGNDILGKVTNKNVADGMPYTTLSFASGKGAEFTYDEEKKVVLRRNLTEVDTTDVNFLSPSLIKSKSETHGGEDVALFATGPMSHLFHTVHDQTYIANVIGYATCTGSFSDECARKKTKRSVNPRMINKYRK